MATTPVGVEFAFPGGAGTQMEGEVLSYSYSGRGVNTVDVTTLETTSNPAGQKIFEACELTDLGEVSVTFQVDGTAGTPTDDPLDFVGESGTLTLTISDGESVSESAICTGYEINSGGLEDIVTGTARFKLTG